MSSFNGERFSPTAKEGAPARAVTAEQFSPTAKEGAPARAVTAERATAQPG